MQNRKEKKGITRKIIKLWYNLFWPFTTVRTNKSQKPLLLSQNPVILTTNVIQEKKFSGGSTTSLRGVRMSRTLKVVLITKNNFRKINS